MSIDIRESDTEITAYFVPNADNRVRLLSKIAGVVDWMDIEYTDNAEYAILAVDERRYVMGRDTTDVLFQMLMTDHGNRIAAGALPNTIDLDTREQLIWMVFSK